MLWALTTFALSSAAITLAPKASAVHLAPNETSSTVHVAPPMLARACSGPSEVNQLSFFHPQENLPGACGKINQDSDFVVALSPDIYLDGANCGRTIQVSSNGKTTTGTVNDECAACSGAGIDMSVGMFEFFAPLEAGEITVDYQLC
ncbi:RlpA-like double-psi beta-barrel-protein domain-containing protein-containing protein [Mycena capillaripes]|nr:RlpA-like double-psi beta-barrel-protein domain-containing protein-containing protein [Mycena capillaripes]